MSKLANRWNFLPGMSMPDLCRTLNDFIIAILTLVNGGLDDGNVPVLEGISGSNPAVKQFSQTFNVTTHWGAASGGYYTISFTHNLGSLAVVPFVFDLTSGQISTQPDRVSVVDINTVSIRTLSDPDLRFAGRVVILG